MSKLRESGERITNPYIIKYFNECLDTLKQLGIMPQDWGNDIVLTQNKALHTFGSMMGPRYEHGYFTLQLSSHLFLEDEKAIKNTIYHELCHYIQMKEQIEEGVIFFASSGGMYISARDRSSGYESSHGGRWQKIAKRVSIATGYNITVTSDYDMHGNVGKEYEKSIKYILKCKKCGTIFKYQKRTDFVNSVLTGNNKRGWHCNCGSKDFEIIKAEN